MAGRHRAPGRPIRPVRKVTAATAAAAAVGLIITVLEQLGVHVDRATERELLTVSVFAAGYLRRP